MVCHVTCVLALLPLVLAHALAMSTCDENVANIFLEGETLEGSCLKDMASKKFWARAGVEPDKTGFTSILLDFEELKREKHGDEYSFLVIKRAFSNDTSIDFEVKWTQEKNNRFFWAEYPDGNYSVYHFFYKGLIVFHRCAHAWIENGNVSFTVVAPIECKPEAIKTTVDELRARLRAKFPSANQVTLDYPNL